MKTLKQYAELINDFKIDRDELSLLFTKQNSKLFTFFNLINSSEIESDEQACLKLYNVRNSPAYRALKTQLKKKLFHAVLILDYKNPKLNEVQQAYYVCQQNWAAINILLGRYKNVAAIDLAQTTLELAKSFNLTEIMVNTSRLLAMQYHLHRPLSITAKKYEKLYADSNNLLQAELLAERFYDDFTKDMQLVRIEQKHLQAKGQRYLDELLPLCSQYDSHRLHVATRLVHIGYYACVNDYENAYKVVNEAIIYIKSYKFELKAQLGIFLRIKTQCCLMLKKYEEGESTAFESSASIPEGTFAWYKLGLSHIYLCFHTCRYDKAMEIFKQRNTHKTFKAQSKIMIEDYRIIEMYLHFLDALNGKKNKKMLNKPISISFNFTILNKKVPILSRNNTGMSVPILVIHILYILLYKQDDWEDDFMKRVNALNHFKSRFIQKDDPTYRTNLFISMINQIKRSKFLRSTTEKYTRKTFDTLKNAPIHLRLEAFSIEIFPYENSWQMILDLLI